MPGRVGHREVRGGTVLASLLAHGAVLATVSRCTVGVERTVAAPEAATPVVELVPIEIAAPIEVVFLDDDPGAAVTAPLGSVTRERVSRSRAAASELVSTGLEAEAPVEPPRLSALGMRGHRHDLALARETAERILGNRLAAPETPGEPRWSHDPKIKLVPDGGGRTRIRDVVATFRFAPDGTVDIADVPDFTLPINLPTPSRIRAAVGRIKRATTRGLAAWVEDPYLDTRAGRIQDLPRHLTAVPGACESWRDRMCRTAEDNAVQWEIEDGAIASGVMLAGKADLTSYLHRKFVGDPNLSRKLKILDQTRDERFRIGTAYRAEQQDRSAELAQRNLEALWRTTADPAERRAGLFSIWDECAEPSEEDASAPQGEAGNRARAMVIGWIRSKLPAGSPHAFTADEIATFDDRRASRQHFVPYP